MTDLIDRIHVWRPYTDPPVLTPSMAAGPGQVPQSELAALTTYLAAVVAARPGPVHVNVAFNAAYFGYDLHAGGYVGGPLELDSFATVEHGATTAALPVGAMVALATGAEPRYGEVIYREGAHPAVDVDGTVPAWLSGAPAGADDPAVGAATSSDGVVGPSPGGSRSAAAVVRRERLVLDFDAFTVGFSATAAQLSRLRRQGRWLDERGHVVVDAGCEGTSPDPSEAAQYQRFLLSRAREQMLSAVAPLPLSTVLTAEADPSELEAALAGMFATVAYVLSRLPSARLWGAYAFDRATFAARLNSTGALGGSDLDLLATQLASSASPRRSARRAAAATTAYTAVGPLLEHVAGSAAQLVGVGYASVIAHTNAVIGDYARRESDPDTGLLSGGIGLRVDDTWQRGGVWRVQRPGVFRTDVDVADPLGLGWLEATGQLQQSPEPEPESEPERPEPEPEPEPEPQDPADEGQVLNVDDSQVMWRQTLRLTHLIDSYLPVPGKVVELWGDAIADGTEMRLAVAHDGYDLEPDEASQAVTVSVSGSSWSLTGVAWPLAFFPALRLICSWQRGGRSVRVSSTLLDCPVTVDGDDIEHHYDKAVLTSDNGDPHPGGSGWQGRGPGAGTDADTTWAARVMRAVRRFGLLDADGRASVAQAAAVDHVCGKLAASADVTACTTAIDELVSLGKLARATSVAGGGHAWSRSSESGAGETLLTYTPTVVVGPRRASVPAVLQGLVTARGLDPRMFLDIEVSSHLRRLQPGHQASQAQRDAYRAQREAFHLAGPSDLPHGYTYVSSFHRNS